MQPYGPQHVNPYAGNQMKNGLGTASLVLGILTLLFSWMPFLGFGSYITGGIGVALGIFGIRRVKYGAATNHGVSIAGVTTSGIGLASVVLATVVYSAALYAASQDTTTAGPEPNSVVATDEPTPSSEPTTHLTDEPSAEPTEEPTKEAKPDPSQDHVIFRVWGKAPNGVNITYGNDGSNHSGKLEDGKFRKRIKLDESSLYYAVTAQLHGGGNIKCSVEVNGVKEKSSASGGYNICSAQINGGITGW